MSDERARAREGAKRTHMPKYGVHVNKYYVPDDVPSWAKLNLKQASKKIAKSRGAGTKQTLGKKAKTAVKLANHSALHWRHFWNGWGRCSTRWRRRRCRRSRR